MNAFVLQNLIFSSDLISSPSIQIQRLILILQRMSEYFRSSSV